MRTIKTDVLVVDKGLVGKSGNTVMASGLSVVGPWHLPGDGPEVLHQDALAGGQFLNNRELVRLLIEEAPKRAAQLEEWGLTFDREEDGRYFLLQSGGHRYRRVLVRSDRVGLAIAKTLRRRAFQIGVRLQEDTIVTALLTSGERVVGATAIDCRSGELLVLCHHICFKETKPSSNSRIVAALRSWRLAPSGRCIAFLWQ